MAQGDAPLLVAGTSGVPVDYVVPGAQAIEPLSVRAVFDGTGAAGAFLPAVEIISPGGVVASISAMGATVAAGSSADASWFPGVKDAAAATPASSSGLPIAMLFSDPAGVSIASDSLTHYVSIQDTGGTAGFSTSDATTFTNGSTTAFTGAAVFGIQIHAAGTYAVYNNAFTISGGTAGNRVTTYWAASNGSAPSFFQQGRSAQNNVETWDRGQTGQGPHDFLHEWMTITAGQVPATLAVNGRVNGGGAVVISFQMAVVQLSPTVISRL